MGFVDFLSGGFRELGFHLPFLGLPAWFRVWGLRKNTASGAKAAPEEPLQPSSPLVSKIQLRTLQDFRDLCFRVFESSRFSVLGFRV